MKNVIFVMFLILKLIKATEYCFGIDSISLEGNCVHSDFEDDFTCRDPIKEGTVAKLKCKPWYKKPNKDIIDRIFCNSGHWDHDTFQCEPICGILNLKRFNPTVTWHARIYKNGAISTCGGTIISEKLIISSASCVWDEENEKVMDLSAVSVFVGSLTRTGYNLYLDQDYNVTEIHVSNRFRGINKSKEDDIAIIVVKGYIAFSFHKEPICIEWLNGKIVESGFGGGIITRYASNVINTDCRNATASNEDSILKLLCEHHRSEDETELGIQGSGFVIEKVINDQKVYFLRGILSNITVVNMSDPIQHSVTVINIQQHSELISEYLTKYSGEVINKEWKSKNLLHCDVPFIPNVIVSVEDEHGMRKNLSPGDSVFDLSKIVYNCGGNHRIRGTRTNFCQGKNWAENHPVCIDTGNIKNTTAPPNGSCAKPDIPNLIITPAFLEKEITENFIRNSTEVMYRCAMHYHLVGILRNSCLNGKWRWKSHPSCLSIYENPPSENCEVPFIPNSIITLEGPVKRNVSVGNYVESSNGITYSCSEKYLLHGVPSNYCHEGKWVAVHPQCVILTIDEWGCELPIIENGFTVIEAAVKKNIASPVVYIPHRSYLYYQCKKNYVLDGPVRNRCFLDTFDNDHSKCIKRTPNDCEIPVIAYAIISLEGEVKKIVSFGSYVENFNIISYKCKEKHLLQGRSTNNCIQGKWTDEHPICVKYCSSDTLKGVTFSAICEFDNVRISCDQYLRTGTTARIFCQYGYRKPDPFVRDELVCNEFGLWDHNPYRCEPKCGTELTETVPYIRGGEKTNITAVPWHVAIYSLVKGRPTQICGGTILNAKLVLSAAHCFWQTSNTITVSSNISVAAGKYYRSFEADEPLSPQFFNVSEIIIPESFQGPLQAYHDDIAILVLSGYIEYKPYIKPICIEWLDQEEKTVQSGLNGRIAGWGRTSSDLPSKELKLLDISTLSYADCIAAADVRFRDKIAGDKFCISSEENESVCPGDSGGGFAIPRMVNGIRTYFLWGVLSNGLTDTNDCNSVNLTTLTNIQHYRDLITNYERKHNYN